MRCRRGCFTFVRARSLLNGCQLGQARFHSPTPASHQEAKDGPRSSDSPTGSFETTGMKEARSAKTRIVTRAERLSQVKMRRSQGYVFRLMNWYTGTYLIALQLFQMTHQPFDVGCRVPFAALSLETSSPSKGIDHGSELTFGVASVVTHPFCATEYVSSVRPPTQNQS